MKKKIKDPIELAINVALAKTATLVIDREAFGKASMWCIKTTEREQFITEVKRVIKEEEERGAK